MKILYIHQYFHTPEQGGGTRSYWIARKMVERGHQVVIITQSDEYKIKTIVNYENFKVIYLKGNYSNYMSKWNKVYSFISFMYKSILESTNQRDVDCVFATSTPLTIGIPALILKWLKNIPYVFEVRDLWPEFPIQIGAIKNKFLISILQFLEKTIYKNANHVIALSPGMQDGVIKYIPKSKTTVIPNMSKPDKFYPRLQDDALYEKYKLDKDKFFIVHFGAIAPK